MKREPKVKPVRAWAFIHEGGREINIVNLHLWKGIGYGCGEWLRVEIRPVPKPSAKGAGTARPSRSAAEAEGEEGEAMNEMQRVLAALDAHGRINGAGVHADAARLIRELSRQLEAEEATNDRLRDEIAEAVGARERMATERDEAIAARETYAMTAREDVIRKAKAVDALLDALKRSE